MNEGNFKAIRKLKNNFFKSNKYRGGGYDELKCLVKIEIIPPPVHKNSPEGNHVIATVDNLLEFTNFTK